MESLNATDQKKMELSCMEHEELLEKQSTLQRQLLGLGGWSELPVPDEMPIVPSAQKPNTCHWDYVLKEMEWLATDFQKERGRHSSNAKKITKGVETYSKTRELKRAKKAKVNWIFTNNVSFFFLFFFFSRPPPKISTLTC